MSEKSKLFTKEEELLLQDFSRTLSTKSSILLKGTAAAASLIPIWLFWKIHFMDLYTYCGLFFLVTVASSGALYYAYKNTKYSMKHQIAVKRGDAVFKEVSQKLAENKNQKMSKKEKDETILAKKNEVVDYESTTFSIFYNNALFFTIIIVMSFFILRTTPPTINYVASVGLSSAFLALLSTGSR